MNRLSPDPQRHVGVRRIVLPANISRLRYGKIVVDDDVCELGSTRGLPVVKMILVVDVMSPRAVLATHTRGSISSYANSQLMALAFVGAQNHLRERVE